MSLMPPQNFRKVQSIHRIGLAADKPSAADVLEGTLYFSTDTLTLERSDGSTWHVYSGTGGSGGNPFDQSLNTTDSPTFVAVTYTEGPLTVHGDEITVLGPATLDDWFDQNVKEGASPIFQNLKVSTLVVDDTNQLEMGGYVLTLTDDVTLPGSITLPTDILGRVLISQGAGIPAIFSPNLTLTGTVKAQEVDVVGISGEGALIILKDTSAAANNQLFYIRSQGGGINFQAVDDVGAVKASLSLANGAIIVRPGPVGAGVIPQVILSKDTNDTDPSYPKIQGKAGIVELLRYDNADRVTLLAKGLGDTPLNADNLTSGTVPPARLGPTTPTAHHATHESGGSDEILFPVGIKERGRSVPIGEWIDVPYSAANFATATGTWTVDSGDIFSYAYTLIGKTMQLCFFFFNTTTSAATSELRLTIPGGFTTSKFAAFSGGIAFNGTTWSTAYISLSPGNAYVALRVFPDASINWPAGTNNISVSGMVTIPLT